MVIHSHVWPWKHKYYKGLSTCHGICITSLSTYKGRLINTQINHKDGHRLCVCREHSIDEVEDHDFFPFLPNAPVTDEYFGKCTTVQIANPAKHVIRKLTSKANKQARYVYEGCSFSFRMRCYNKCPWPWPWPWYKHFCSWETKESIKYCEKFPGHTSMSIQ